VRAGVGQLGGMASLSIWIDNFGKGDIPGYQSMGPVHQLSILTSGADRTHSPL